MHDLHKLEELICNEIDSEVAKGSLTPDTVRTIGYAVDILNDITEMEKNAAEMEDGYSGRYGYNIMPYSYERERMPERSYAQRRDRLGRYSRNERSYGRDEKIEHLERMMNEARDEQEREEIRKLIVRMENN